MAQTAKIDVFTIYIDAHFFETLILRTLEPLLHGHLKICRPFINGCFIISYLIKANGLEDHGGKARSYTHGSV